MKELDLKLTKGLLDSVTNVLKDSSKVKAEQDKATNEQLAARYKAMPKPTSMQDAKVESYAAKAPERRLNDAIAAVYTKSFTEANDRAKAESDAIKTAYAARGGVKPVTESIIVEGQGVHVLDDEGETHVHIKDAKNVKEVDDAVVQHLVTKHKMSPEKARKTYREVSSDTPFHHDKPEKGHSVDVVRSKAEHAKQVGDYVHGMVAEDLTSAAKKIVKKTGDIAGAAGVIAGGIVGGAAKTAGVVRQTIPATQAAYQKGRMVTHKAIADDVQYTEALSPKQKKHIDKNKNNKIDAHDFEILRTRKAKMATEVSDETILDGETIAELKDTPGNSYDHQCAIHVKHASMGEGRTLFSQHAKPDAEGQIAWYDVMFAEGIEKKVPTTDLEIIVSESHMNHKKKKKM